MAAESVIVESQFSNTYGGLDLVEREGGERYLRMMDCLGPGYFGLLTDDQVAAFHVLCSVPVAT